MDIAELEALIRQDDAGVINRQAVQGRHADRPLHGAQGSRSRLILVERLGKLNVCQRRTTVHLLTINRCQVAGCRMVEQHPCPGVAIWRCQGTKQSKQTHDDGSYRDHKRSWS
jgi:hypothetical protein